MMMHQHSREFKRYYKLSHKGSHVGFIGVLLGEIKMTSLRLLCASPISSLSEASHSCKVYRGNFKLNLMKCLKTRVTKVQHYLRRFYPHIIWDTSKTYVPQHIQTLRSIRKRWRVELTLDTNMWSVSVSLTNRGVSLLQAVGSASPLGSTSMPHKGENRQPYPSRPRRIARSTKPTAGNVRQKWLSYVDLAGLRAFDDNVTLHVELKLCEDGELCLVNAYLRGIRRHRCTARLEDLMSSSVVNLNLLSQAVAGKYNVCRVTITFASSDNCRLEAKNRREFAARL